MKYLKAILILNLLVVCQGSVAQSVELKRTYHWFFGDSCGLDFSSGIPVADTNGILTTLEGSASISDTSGKLLFYTDGTFVWDSTHTQMPNGFGLHGNWSSSNSAVIVPKPGSNNLYYIFTTPAYGGHWSGNLAMEYAVVDMNLNSGLGDVVLKNVEMFSTSTEQLGVTKHQNGIDYWIVGHQVSSKNFMTFLLSDSGVSTTPIVSNVGMYLPDFDTCWYCPESFLKISPSGCRIATTHNNADSLWLFDFDINSGAVMNPIVLYLKYNWGVCFSPNDQLLYATSYDNIPVQDQFCQFNLSSNNVSTIMASKIILSIDGISASSTMQLGPDGKIYCTRYPDTDYLAVINAPNIPGVGCSLVLNGVHLGGRRTGSGITNFVQSYFKNETLEYSCSYIGIPNEYSNYEIQVFPNPMSDYFVISSGIDLEDATLRIFSLQGQKLREINNVNGQSNTIERGNLSNGIYVIQVIQNGKVVTTKKLLVID